MKRLAALVAIALVALLGYGIYDAGRDERAPPPKSSDIRLTRGHASGQRVKFKSWSADYDRVISNADQTILDISGVHNGTIYKGGKPYLHVRAAHMSVNTITRDFSVTGPLYAESIGATPTRSFETTSATWSDATQRLVLNKRVVIRTGAEGPLTVSSLTLNVKTGDITINDIDGPVRVK